VKNMRSPLSSDQHPADAQTIAKALGGRRFGAYWMARCPCHSDRVPSMSITDAKNGKVLVHCHTGCDQTQVIAALHSLGLWETESRDKSRSPRKHARKALVGVPLRETSQRKLTDKAALIQCYGPPDQLPFDMRHLRYPLQYDLPPMATNTDRRAVRKTLAEESERILRLMIAAAPVQQGTPFQEADSVASPAFFFQPSTTIAAFDSPEEQEYLFERDKAIYLRLFPKYTDGQPKLKKAQLRTLSTIVAF
jgi:hypothetical protein